VSGERQRGQSPTPKGQSPTPEGQSPASAASGGQSPPSERGQSPRTEGGQSPQEPEGGQSLRERMTWADLGDAVHELSRQVGADGFRPDAVLALARGGLPLAGALAYALGVKSMATLNVEFYTGVDERLEEPLLLPPVPDLAHLRGERLLVVDDVADTGRTLALVRDFCAEHSAEVRTAVLYQKPHSLVSCDYVWRRTDRWIEFPWSAPTAVQAAVSASA
jgi:hypoxanthine phosphoribosyltransferase